MFRLNCILKLLLIIAITLPNFSYTRDNGPVAWWKLDSLDKEENINPLTRKGRPTPEIDRVYSVNDDVSGNKDRVVGTFFKLVPGVRGNAILLDGNTSYIQRRGESVPKLTNEFSVDAWVALGAYPTNWCPIIDHSSNSDNGFFFGIDAYGRPGFRIRTEDKWVKVVSEKKIQLRKWVHIAGLYSLADGLTLYLNGEPVSQLNISKPFKSAGNAVLLIGKHSIKRRPEGTIRPKGTAPVYTFFDGILDEIRIFNKHLSGSEIKAYYDKFVPKSGPQLAIRTLPAGPPKGGVFSAVYTTLKYYPAWDALWPVGDHADVVVRFDEFDGRLVFWRGTSYVPHWVTENSIWFNNEFAETWSNKGCHEPMSDKRCDFSYVRIIENNKARVVVHWRYALVDNWYSIARKDTLTGFGEWVDEVFTIYPDGVAVREMTLYSIQPQSPHEWHESIIVMSPGQRPEQVLEPEALTIANMKGETYTFTWANGLPKETGKMGLVHVLENPIIQLINTKSEYKPFVIVSPQSNPSCQIFSNKELRPDVSMFPWWNHWPAAQKGSDGRYALESDRASHTSLSNCHWDAYKITEKTQTKLMLNGLTNKRPEQLIALAASWSNPPTLSVKSSGIENKGYDPASRAYLIDVNQTENSDVLEFEIKATEESPLVNPAFVLKNCRFSDIALLFNGRKLVRDSQYRQDSIPALKGSDLVIWLKYESKQHANIKIQPTG